MIVARQFIAWKGVQTGIRPVGYGLILPGLINRPKRGAPIGPNRTVPSGTVPAFALIPGNKLPGYFHNVPTGQRHLTPFHEFGSTSWSVGVLRQVRKAPAYQLEVLKGRPMIRSDISLAVWLTNTDSTAPLGRIILWIYTRG
jgi:hypothetical protein